MGDAPEKIWVENLKGNWRHYFNCSLEKPDKGEVLSIPKIEYIRADTEEVLRGKRCLDNSEAELHYAKQEATKNIRAAYNCFGDLDNTEKGSPWRDKHDRKLIDALLKAIKADLNEK